MPDNDFGAKVPSTSSEPLEPAANRTQFDIAQQAQARLNEVGQPGENGENALPDDFFDDLLFVLNEQASRSSALASKTTKLIHAFRRGSVDQQAELGIGDIPTAIRSFSSSQREVHIEIARSFDGLPEFESIRRRNLSLAATWGTVHETALRLLPRD